MAWRTSTSGHARRATGFITGHLHKGQPISGGRIEENGLEPPPRCDHKRYCQECGKEVCTYKDVYMDDVWCYAHDHLTPWTHRYIMGAEPRKRPPIGISGRGRKGKTWFYS